MAGLSVHHHGQSILKAGFSMTKCADICAFECPPAPHDVAAIKANDEMIQLSGGSIPPLSGMRLLACGGNHTNSFLRGAKAGVRTEVTELQDASGKLDPMVIGASQLAFLNAVQDGMNWLIMDWRFIACVVLCASSLCPLCRCCSSISCMVGCLHPVSACRLDQEIPNLVHFVQSALNVRAGTQHTEIEVMLEMVRMVQDGADWNRVEKECSQLLSNCAQYSKIMAVFVRLQPAEIIRGIALFYKAHISNDGGPNRFMGSEWIGNASSLNFGKFEKLPLVMTAVWKANLSSKCTKLVDGYCRLVLPSHLSLLTSPANRKNVQHAEKVMTDARDVCKHMNINIADSTRIMGNLDCRLVLMLCKLSKTAGEQQYDSFDLIGQAAAWSLCVVC